MTASVYGPRVSGRRAIDAAPAVTYMNRSIRVQHLAQVGRAFGDLLVQLVLHGGQPANEARFRKSQRPDLRNGSTCETRRRMMRVRGIGS